MRHAEPHLLHALIAAALDDLLECRDQRLAAVEAEAFGAGELGVAELLEALGLDQLVEDGALALAGESDLLVGAFDALLDPAFLVGVRDVHELDAERFAVGALTDRDDLAQRGEFEPQHVIEENLAVVVVFDEPIGARIELLVVLARLKAERIELGVEVATDAVGRSEERRVGKEGRSRWSPYQ